MFIDCALVGRWLYGLLSYLQNRVGIWFNMVFTYRLLDSEPKKACKNFFDGSEECDMAKETDRKQVLLAVRRNTPHVHTHCRPKDHLSWQLGSSFCR
jgi:hypothetical protein